LHLRIGAQSRGVAVIADVARLFMRVRGIFAVEQKLHEPFVTSVIERRHGSLSSTVMMIQNTVRSKAR
jgi:hypothetical protein